MFKKIITFLAQKLADTIIQKMSNTTNEDTFNHLYEFGMKLNSFCIDNFEIYLD
jgi:hypothetical protein